MFEYPSVFTTVGKKFVTDADETMESIRMVKTHVLTSSRANLRPWKKVCDSEDTQSSSPISSSRRKAASWRSSSVSHDVVRGKFGRIQNAAAAIPTVMPPYVY